MGKWNGKSHKRINKREKGQAKAYWKKEAREKGKVEGNKQGIMKAGREKLCYIKK